MNVCDYCDIPFSISQGNRKYCDDCRINRKCAEDGCDRLARKRNGVCTSLRCVAHEARRKRGGNMTLAIKTPAPNGSGSITDDGYRRITVNGQKMLEHRHVMEQTLGRQLDSRENVHHMNGNKLDNRPENLELWVVQQPKGQRVEDIIAWAKEVLATYEPTALCPA